MFILFLLFCFSFGVVQHSGYIKTNEKRDHNLFYWFIESQNDPKTDPIIMWMQGGPGSSFSIGSFYEIGPYFFDPDDPKSLNLVPNVYTWNLEHSLLFIDQPVGTGFSYAKDHLDYYKLNETAMMEEVHSLLTTFFSMYPEYSSQDFYLFGESYGGRYVPVLGSQLVDDPSINLKGIGCGDCWIDGLIQNKAFIEFSLQEGLISPTLSNELMKAYNDLCKPAIEKKDWIEAAAACNGITAVILADNGGMSFYDIRLKCNATIEFAAHDCYDFSQSEKYLNLESTRKELGVGDHKWENHGTGMGIASALEGDEERSYKFEIPKILEAGVNVLIYNGEYDFAANWLGGLEWTNAMEWQYQKEYSQKNLTEWMFLEKKVGGWAKNVENFTFLKVKDAGHMVPMNQPVISLMMLNEFIEKGKLQ